MKIEWDKVGEHVYETGVKHGVLYPITDDGTYPKGVAWNGLTSVTESPSGAETTSLYADDMKYLNLISAEEFGNTIEAYTYPEEFSECDGSAELAEGVVIGQQDRKAFGLSYLTTIGNDVKSNNYGYKIHLIYNSLAQPSERAYSSINDSPEAISFSWETKSTPVNVTGHKATSCMTIDSTKVAANKLAKLETVLYGSDPTLLDSEPSDWSTSYKNYLTKGENGEYTAVTGGTAPSFAKNKYYTAGADARLPLPDEVVSILAGE